MYVRGTTRQLNQQGAGLDIDASFDTNEVFIHIVLDNAEETEYSIKVEYDTETDEYRILVDNECVWSAVE